MGVIQMSKGNLPFPDQLLSEPALVCKLALAYFGDQSTVRWEKYLEHNDHIRNDIAKTIPGFDNYNTRVRKLGGFYLPNSSREQKFTVPSGKAEFNIGKVKEFNLKADEYVMMTIRSHDQFNTTIYGLNDRYRGVINERRVIFMNEKDILKVIQNGDVVDLQLDNNKGLLTGLSLFLLAFLKMYGYYFPETNVPCLSTALQKSNTLSQSLLKFVGQRLLIDKGKGQGSRSNDRTLEPC